MSITMQFGNVSKEKVGLKNIELIESGELKGENLDYAIIDLSSHQMYVLFTREITISSGGVRGFRSVLIARTENDGTVQRGNLYASANSGVTVSVADEVLTIKPSSASYDVYYSLYSVM